MYRNSGCPAQDIQEHWHYVSFGLSDLYGDNRGSRVSTLLGILHYLLLRQLQGSFSLNSLYTVKNCGHYIAKVRIPLTYHELLTNTGTVCPSLVVILSQHVQCVVDLFKQWDYHYPHVYKRD